MNSADEDNIMLQEDGEMRVTEKWKMQARGENEVAAVGDEREVNDKNQRGRVNAVETRKTLSPQRTDRN